MSEVISQAELLRLIDGWLGQQARVIGPRCVTAVGAAQTNQADGKPARAVVDRILYQDLRVSADLVLDAAVRPGNSIKEVVFPRHEKLYGYKLSGKQIELIDLPPPTRPQIVVGARPCDAAALPILDHVFHWDYVDSFYAAHREATTVITLACTAHDAHCFCTSVGLAPDHARGSDAMLLELGDGQYEVRVFTDKGRALFAGATQTDTRQGCVGPGPEKTIDQGLIDRFLEHAFTRNEWQAMSLRCLGCGACAFNCPTCHCFDMVDEGNASGGHKVRNWDACQFGLFTLHASGHNPRSNQAQRQRQRIYHKFEMYRQKFGEALCTGCGNCTRACPVQLGVRPVLESLQQAIEREWNG